MYINILGVILFLRRHEGGEGGSPKCLRFSTWGEGGSKKYLRRKVLTKISTPKPNQNPEIECTRKHDCKLLMQSHFGIFL